MKRLMVFGLTMLLAAGIVGAHDETGNRGLSPTGLDNTVEGAIGVCLPVLNKGSIDPVEDERGYYALSVVDHAAGFYAHSPGEDPEVGLEYGKSVVTVLSHPRRGKLRQGPGLNDLSYHPDATHSGNDKAVFLVKQGDHQIKVVYFFKVVRGIDNAEFSRAYKKYCSPPGWWRISTGKPSGQPTVSHARAAYRHG